jgi:hypothetical protein
VVGAGAAQACFDRSRQCRSCAELGDDEEIVVTRPIVGLARVRVAEPSPQPLEEIARRFLILGIRVSLKHELIVRHPDLVQRGENVALPIRPIVKAGIHLHGSPRR